MDKILRDIRNFFKKLESGQIEIEAGQWELHKDVCRIKKLFEELKKLKENVEEMRLTNVKQMGIIKSLEKKLEGFKVRFKEKAEKKSESARPCRCEKKRNSDSGYASKSPQVYRSEEIIEITSCTNSNQSSAPKSEEKEEKEEKPESEPGTEESEKNGSNISSPTRYYPEPDEKPASGQKSRKTCNEILQRYLDDSAKYSRKRGMSTPDTEYCYDTLPQGDLCGDAETWKKYISKLPQSLEGSDRSHDTGESVGSCESIDPIMSMKIPGLTSPKNGMMKADVLRQARYRSSPNQRHIMFKPSRKDLNTLELFRSHRKGHRLGIRKSRVRRCGYCSKVCYTPEMLVSHVNKCRMLMKSCFNRY